MTEIEFIEKYVIVCDKDGNKSQIKLNDIQKRFLEYARKHNIKSTFTLQRRLYYVNEQIAKQPNERRHRRNRG
jgi:hypothetical protein